MVTLRNFGHDGKEVFEVGSQGQPTVLTKGWLRASHRKLDPQKSLPYRPYHAHNERQWLKPGAPVNRKRSQAQLINQAWPLFSSVEFCA